MAFGGDGVTLEENGLWGAGCGFGRERYDSRRRTSRRMCDLWEVRVSLQLLERKVWVIAGRVWSHSV